MMWHSKVMPVRLMAGASCRTDEVSRQSSSRTKHVKSHIFQQEGRVVAVVHAALVARKVGDEDDAWHRPARKARTRVRAETENPAGGTDFALMLSLAVFKALCATVSASMTARRGE